LQRLLAETRFPMENGLELSVQASLGLATAPADGTSVHSILRAADARLYRAKNCLQVN
jgi:GGDEF domain-containing protein